MEYLRKNIFVKIKLKKVSKVLRKQSNFIKKNYSIALMIDQRVSEGEK